MHLRIVFMGTPDFAVPSLDMLVREGYEVTAAVTQPDKPKGRGNKLTQPPVKEYALSAGIPVNQPEKVKTPEFAAWLRGLKPDLLVTAAFGKILSKEILDIPRLGCINVHASLLPKYRGAAPIQWSIINGDSTTGITTMYTDIGMDTGDILLKKEVSITEDMTYEELHDLLAPVGAEVLKETLKKLADGTLVRIPQEEALATHAPMVTRDTGKIDWSKSSREVHNLVRGTNPWPAAFTSYKGERMKVWKTAAVNDEQILSLDLLKDFSAYSPGTICKITRDSLIIIAGDGFIKVLEVQFDGSRKMSVEECGHNMDVGEVLG